MKRSLRSLALLVALAVIAVGALALAGCSSAVKIKALIVPHFEIGEMSGDSAGEAQAVYERYFTGAQQYTLANGQTLYVNKSDGLALCLSGMGKTSMTSCLATTLSDARFDFSQAYLIIGGCSGGNIDYVAFGDVCLTTAAVDFDLGHSVDSSEAGESGQTWYPDSGMAGASLKLADAQLMDRVYDIIKDVQLDTSETVRETMSAGLPDNKVVSRDCTVVRGTSMTSDNYWKGPFEHALALAKTAYYQCPDTYAAAEMEDVAALTVAEQYGMLDRTIVLRVIVNADIFLADATPEALWGNNDSIAKGADNDWVSEEVFPTAMGNLGKVEIALVEAALAGKL